MEDDNITLIAVGDVGPKRDNADKIFDMTRPLLKGADITFGQLESNLSMRGTPQLSMGLGSIAHPKMADVFVNAGFDVMSFASNHSLDWSEEALLDTLDVMKAKKITVIGAGRNISEARKPAVFTKKKTRIGFLAYCSVVPKGFDAREDKSGVVPLRAHTSYEQADWQAGTPPVIHTKVFPQDLAQMEEDIKTLRSQVDVLIVSMHWGVHFVPSIIAQYQYEAGYAAIDAGADLIIGTHAHILKGIEVYKGKVIFFSLCNFNMDLPIAGPMADSMAKSQGRPCMTSVPVDKDNRCRIGHYSWYVDPEYPTYAFPQDSQKSIMVRCRISGKKINQVAFQPLWMTKQGYPEPLGKSDPRSDDVLKYMTWLCEDQGLDTSFTRKGDWVCVNI